MIWTGREEEENEETEDREVLSLVDNSQSLRQSEERSDRTRKKIAREYQINKRRSSFVLIGVAGRLTGQLFEQWLNIFSTRWKCFEQRR